MLSIERRWLEDQKHQDMEQCCSVKACVKAAHRKLLSLGGVGAFYPSQRAVLLVYQPPIYWNIANYVVAIVKEDGCRVRVKEGCWCSICSPLTLSKKEATMVGCWWQPTTIV